MLAYLTDLQRQEDTFDILSFSLNALGALTIIHLFATYFIIKFILSRKHSESIRTAEEYSQVSKFSVLGFRKLLLFLTLLCVCITAKSIINQKKIIYDTKKKSSPPPVTVISTMLATVTCFYFVFSKQKIRAFMIRRVFGYLESLFPSMFFRSRKIGPAST